MEDILLDKILIRRTIPIKDYNGRFNTREEAVKGIDKIIKDIIKNYLRQLYIYKDNLNVNEFITLKNSIFSSYRELDLNLTGVTFYKLNKNEKGRIKFIKVKDERHETEVKRLIISDMNNNVDLDYEIIE